MSLSYVKSMYWVFKSYVMCHTEALCKFYDIVMSFAIYFDKKSYFFASQMKPLHSIFKSYVVWSSLWHNNLNSFYIVST